tara:strand:- start:2995 stop:3171 length:177 start_codon:yes stop_codon:yes gene_type:complete
MGFLGNLIGGAIKVVITPIAIVKDVVNGTPFETTGDVLDSALNSLDDALDDLIDGDLI